MLIITSLHPFSVELVNIELHFNSDLFLQLPVPEEAFLYAPSAGPNSDFPVFLAFLIGQPRDPFITRRCRRITIVLETAADAPRGGLVQPHNERDGSQIMSGLKCMQSVSSGVFGLPNDLMATCGEARGWGGLRCGDVRRGVRGACCCELKPWGQ